MSRLRNRRAIIDRQALGAALSEAAEHAGAGAPGRQAVLATLKEALEAGRHEICRRFDDGAAGPLTAAGTTFLIDQLIVCLYVHAAERVYPEPNPTAADRLALVAVGGYGRGELAPHSDVDLLFLLPYKQTPRG